MYLKFSIKIVEKKLNGNFVVNSTILEKSEVKDKLVLSI